MNVIFVIRRKQDSETSIANSYRDIRSILAYTTEGRAKAALKRRYGNSAEEYEIIGYVPKEDD